MDHHCFRRPNNNHLVPAYPASYDLDNGVYEIFLQAGEVFDASGNLAVVTRPGEQQPALLGTFVVNVPAPGTFVVNSHADTIDVNPGDGIAEDEFGNSTLRAAVMEANAMDGENTIILPGGTYTLTIEGIDENFAETGDLDIQDDARLTILGDGESETIIDGNGIDRVFHVRYCLHDGYKTLAFRRIL